MVPLMDMKEELSWSSNAALLSEYLTHAYVTNQAYTLYWQILIWQFGSQPPIHQI